MSTNQPPHPHRTIRRLTAVVLLAAVAASACSEDPEDASAPTTSPGPSASTVPPDASTTTVPTGPVEPVHVEADLVGTALNGPTFSQLAGMVVDAGLIETLRGGPFTVFAPTNDAFRKLPLDALHGVQDDPELLATVLTYHVVPGTILAADLEEGTLETVAGIDLEITRDGDRVFVNGFEIATADVSATNGVIHVMDDVLLPPS